MTRRYQVRLSPHICTITIACELPSRLGLPLSRLHVPDIVSVVRQHGIVAEISGTTVWRWLSEDVIKP